MSEATQGEWRVTAMPDRDQLIIETEDYVIAECNEIVERDVANFNAIVHCVNNHERLVEALRVVVDAVHDFDPHGEAIDNTYTEGAVKLLAQLEAGKGGE